MPVTRGHRPRRTIRTVRQFPQNHLGINPRVGRTGHPQQKTRLLLTRPKGKTQLHTHLLRVIHEEKKELCLLIAKLAKVRKHRLVRSDPGRTSCSFYRRIKVLDPEVYLEEQ